jgi:hypothetical protein
MFANETMQGSFAVQFKTHLQKHQAGVQFKDPWSFFQDVMNVKTKDQMAALTVSAKFTEYIFRDLVDKIETVIDEGKSDRHD